MNYEKAVEYVNSFINFEKISKYSYASSFKLERMRAFLEKLENPHQGLDFIHIAGSKGKGSTSAVTAYILKECGHRVGLYTSPHLVDMRERIRVLDKETRDKRHPSASLGTRGTREFEGAIEEKEFSGLLEEIKPVSEEFREHEKFGRLSFFEILTAAAFLYFKRKKVDIVILETGLGGRLDATNVAEPIVCGITNISLEHTDKLGNSLESIAREKAGIIKVRGIVVSAPQEEKVIDVIRKVCLERDCRLYEVGKDIVHSIKEDGGVFDLKGPGYSYKDLRINLLGRYQVDNACVAIGMARTLCEHGFNVEEHGIRSGLKNVLWPGRLQVSRERPYLILDGAQNVASLKASLSSIKAIFSYDRLISVFGISKDKDIEGVSRQLENASDVIILTKAASPRAEDPLLLSGRFSHKDIRITDNVKQALEAAFEISNKKDLILVTGSLYVVGEAIAHFPHNIGCI